MVITFDGPAGGGVTAVLEGPCVRVEMAQIPSETHPLHVSISDATGTLIGTASISQLQRGGVYVPVDGQLGVVTIRAGRQCP
jgi:penicillin V acylase-like amidase (Ntn superfamily)